MTAVVVEIAMIVSVFMYKLLDIFPLLILIITSKDDAAVEVYSCVKHMLGELCWHFLEKFLMHLYREAR